jgi:DNA-binding protein HU-beta
MNTTKADLVDIVSRGTGITKIETAAIIEGFLRSIIDTLAENKSIEIRGFGSFKVKKRKARKARNPRSGEEVFVEEHYVPAFKFSREFKEMVNEGIKNNIKRKYE